ncbi:ribonuclease H protein, partial [Trifolium medium]|nr:ribonuclease H protein [Trifolium medium]
MRRLNFHVVELHVDSKVVVHAIMRHGSGSLHGKALVERIRRLIDMDWEVVVHHSYREANQCADVLANHGCNMQAGCVYFDHCPNAYRHP